MNSRQKIKWDIYKVLLLICAIATIIIALVYQNKISTLDIDKEGLSQIETIHSGVQRVSKLELEYSPDTELIATIDAVAFDLIPINKKSKYFNNSQESSVIAKNIVGDWNTFKESLDDFHINGDRDILFFASENNYNDSSSSIKIVKAYIDKESETILQLQMSLSMMVAVIVLILLKVLFSTFKELQHNKEISKEMYIDTATGIYNRSKCQEVMKMPISTSDKERAVVIFDLNDLKKTNDSLGHRAGDQLIFHFAEQVKNATNIFSYEIFVGRYGGDEFMAFLDSVDQRDVERYIEEVNYLLNQFNETQNKSYKLSCAAGYGITTKDTKMLTTKELFDIADEDMYKNKIAMKAKKKQELIAQGIELPDEVDDRL